MVNHQPYITFHINKNCLVIINSHKALKQGEQVKSILIKDTYMKRVKLKIGLLLVHQKKIFFKIMSDNLVQCVLCFWRYDQKLVLEFLHD